MVEPVVKAQAGILKSSRQLGVDQAYEERLIGLIDKSSLDAVLLLAMDYPYDSNGNCLKGKAKFYVPNDHVLNLSQKYPQILPACSIHPARTDAIEELERFAEKGAKVLKLLPNCHNVDCSDRQYLSFWQKLAKLGLPSLPTLEENFRYQYSMRNLPTQEFFDCHWNVESK